ncbi:Insect cuticle protein [Nesidiocoris tenuis]|uniref:Insect cuticle protein n=1 Tax=Nesidiocoris tenuis TaxID=355587 RepID=A0ABN7ALS5_9HEMI|nr:Insect cuticle protein [Nesidiocoris tenuis]
MIRTVCLLALAAYVTGQYHGDPRNAAILTDSRYLNGDGKFGAAYSQEDGVEFKEETDADGTRRGSYSYVDPSGQRKTVSYTAGKNGFQASGSHLPTGPNQLGVAPTPGYVPLPEYNPPEDNQPRAAYRPAPVKQSFNPAPVRERNYNVAPVEPAYNPAPVRERNYNPAPVQQPIFNPAPVQQQPVYRTTTPQPRRFFPPGKLSLNRSPDGYSYTFNKA